MAITLNGTTGITNGGGYTGDGVTFADNTPSNTLVTDTSGNVGVGTASPTTRLHTYTAGVSLQAMFEGTTLSPYIQVKGNSGSTLVGNESTGGWVGTIGSQALVIKTNDTERMRIDTSGNLLFNSGYGSVATAYGCRAWVNFNGQGTVAIRSSGNVSSITDNGTGDYTVNFTSAMPDANYSANVTGNVLNGAGNTSGWIAAELLSSASASYRTSSAFRLFTTGLNGSNQDGYSVNLSFFR